MSLLDLFSTHQSLPTVIGMGALEVIEFWLGKTPLFPAGSLIELGITGVSQLVGLIFPKQKEDHPMNEELKNLIQMALDVYGAGKAVVAKEEFVTVVLPRLYKIAGDVPGVASKWSQLKAEIEALPGTAQEADLIAFIVSQFSTEGDKARGILKAVLTLISDLFQNVIALEGALKA